MKKDSPLVSCLVPTYNRSEYLAESLNSILEQTYKNYEVIVVDDGSTDSTPILMKWFTGKYPKIKYFRCPHKGIAATRNFAIKQSKGDLIGIFDSDDMYANRRLQKQVAALEKHPEADFCYSGYMEANEHMEGTSIVEPPVEFTAQGIRDNKTIPHGTTLARRHCFIDRPYNERFTSNDDKKLFWDWFRAGYKGWPVNDTLYLKRNHMQAVSIVEGEQVHKFNIELDKEIDEYLKKTKTT
jgi:glycosyltransferase involved in cell wall biosynthesis